MIDNVTRYEQTNFTSEENVSFSVDTYASFANDSSLEYFTHYDVLMWNTSGNGSQENESYIDEDYWFEVMCLEHGSGTTEYWAREAVSLVMQLLILLSNSFIVLAVLRQWAREGRPLGSRAAACFLVVNLAAADAVLGLFMIVQWLHSTVCAFYEVMSVHVFTCFLPNFLMQIGDIASALTVISIAADRVMSVTHAVQYRNYLSPRRSAVAIHIIWVVAVFISLSIYIPGVYNIEKTEYGVECKINATYELSLFWITVITIFCVLIGCYWTIHRVTLHMIRRGSTCSPRNVVGTKAARMLLIVIAWDSCAYFPLLVVTFLQLGGVEVGIFAENVARNLTMLTFLADPYIYAYGNPHTKRAISDFVLILRGQSPSRSDVPGNRESLAETSVNKIRRMMSSLTASTNNSDGDRASPTSRRNSLRLT